MTGTIVDNIGTHWLRISTIYFANNYFSGTIPSSFDHKFELEVFLINGNMFTGSISSGLPTRSLQCFDVSENYLTGYVPSTLFSNTSLSTLVLTSNCLRISFTDHEICKLQDTLVDFFIDSIHGASNCQQSVLPSFLTDMSIFPSTYQSNNPIRGHLPECLFNDFQVIESIHISGNSMSGSIPSNITQMPLSLKNLSLSHNLLTGTIPRAIQSHLNWTVLDLSFNKLQGTLVDDFSHSFDPISHNHHHEDVITDTTTSKRYIPIPSLNLNINQLSGSIPKSLKNALSINILTGNIFTCSADRESLPTHDMDRHAFQCGSDAVDTSIYIWLGSMLLVIGSVIVVPKLCWKHTEMLNTWQRCRDCWDKVDQYGQHERSVHRIVILFDMTIRFTIFLMVFIIFVSIPIYVTLSTYYATVTPGYAWDVGMINKKGIIVTVIVGISLLAIVVLTCYYRQQLYNFYHADSSSVEMDQSSRFKDVDNTSSNSQSNESDNQLVGRSTTYNDIRRWLAITFFLLLNVIVVLTVNIVYVSLTSPLNTSLSILEKQLISFVTSLFKIGWNELVIATILTFSATTVTTIAATTSINSGDSESHLRGSSQRPTSSINTSTVNQSFVIQPSVDQSMVSRVTVALTDVFVRAPVKLLQQRTKELQLNFMLLLFFNNIIAPCVAMVLYSEDCLYYAFAAPPNIVSTYYYHQLTIELIHLIIVPFEIFVSQDIRVPAPFQYRYRCTSTLLMTFAAVFLYRFIIISINIPLLWIIIKWIQNRVISSYDCRLQTDRDPQTYDIEQHRSLVEADRRFQWTKKLLPKHWQIHALSRPEDIQVIFPGEKTTLFLMSDMAIILVFGVIFPPLAIVGCISVLMTIATHRLLLGYALLVGEESTSMEKSKNGGSSSLSALHRQVLVLLLKDTRRLATTFSQAFSRVLWLVPLVWSVFLFDILGEDVGATEALPVVGVMGIVVPLFIIVLQQFWKSSNNLTKTFNGGETMDAVAKTDGPKRSSVRLSQIALTSSTQDSIIQNPIILIKNDSEL